MAESKPSFEMVNCCDAYLQTVGSPCPGPGSLAWLHVWGGRRRFLLDLLLLPGREESDHGEYVSPWSLGLKLQNQHTVFVILHSCNCRINRADTNLWTWDLGWCGWSELLLHGEVSSLCCLSARTSLCVGDTDPSGVSHYLNGQMDGWMWSLEWFSSNVKVSLTWNQLSYRTAPEPSSWFSKKFNIAIIFIHSEQNMQPLL